MIELVVPHEKWRQAFGTHPKVSKIVLNSEQSDLTFSIGTWARSISVGHPENVVSGLVELMDNNPMVCADHIDLPDPFSTLALIALGPIIDAGLLQEPPVVQTNLSVTLDISSAYLEKLGWGQGLVVNEQPDLVNDAATVSALAVISTPDDLSELDELFAERFSRSFYVRKVENEPWDVRLIAGKPFAVYQLRITPDEPYSLLRVLVLASKIGKAEGAQAVHAFNVMNGFEESLGI